MKDLKQIRIHNPCNESWDVMRGDERSRLCDRCETRVVNLSSMTSEEVDELASSGEERFCVRYLAEPNGPPILRSSRRRSFLRRLALVLAIFVPALAAACRDDPREEDETSERVGNGRVGVGNGPVEFMGLE